MDVIERFSIIPCLFSIVDLEVGVWRYPGWLNRTEIIGDDCRAWKLVGEFDCPDACSCSDIQYALNILRYRSSIEFTAEDKLPNMVNQI